MTRLTKIPGVPTSPSGVNIADFPFRKDGLAAWGSAFSVATSPYSVSGTATGEAGIDTFIDQQSGAAYPAYATQSWVTKLGGGSVPYAQSRLGAASSRRGQALPVNLVQSKAGVTLFALARLTVAPTGSRTIIGYGVDTTQTQMLSLGFDSSRRPRITAKRAALADTSGVALGAAQAINVWAGMIGIADYANNAVSIEVVGPSDSSGVGTPAIGGTAGANSGAPAGAALGLGMALSTTTPTSGTAASSDVAKFVDGDLADWGIFTKVVSGTQLTTLKNYLRDMAKLLNS